MGALQLQSNGDGAAEGLLPDPGYVEVDPTGRYGRVRSIVFVFVFISPLAFLFLLARLLLPLVDMLRRVVWSIVVLILINLASLLCSEPPTDWTAVQRDSRQGVLKDCVRSSIIAIVVDSQS